MELFLASGVFELKTKDTDVMFPQITLTIPWSGPFVVPTLTLYLWCFSYLIKVVLSVHFGVLVQGALVREGQHILQDVHLPQDLTQAVDTHGLLVSDDGTSQVSFACNKSQTELRVCDPNQCFLRQWNLTIKVGVKTVPTETGTLSRLESIEIKTRPILNTLR